MYSTVIEGLKYASSHEWYVFTHSFSQSLFWVNFRFGFTLLLCCSGTHFFVFFLSLLFSYPFVTYTFHMHIASTRVKETSLDAEREREKEREKRVRTRAKFTRHRDER